MNRGRIIYLYFLSFHPILIIFEVNHWLGGFRILHISSCVVPELISGFSTYRTAAVLLISHPLNNSLHWNWNITKRYIEKLTGTIQLYIRMGYTAISELNQIIQFKLV
jgi:hypothetical protein